MPILERISRWAAERPSDLAVVCGDQYLDWHQLCTEAAALAASRKATGMIRQGNGVDFAVRWAAGVAQERACAVLDPSWPEAVTALVQECLAERYPADQAPARLRDADPTSPFLIGLTSGTTAIPKGFSRTRASWQGSFEASIDCFGLEPQDRVLAPGPLSASLNLYALSEALYAGATFHTLARFDVAAAHSEITASGITRLVVVPTMLRVLAQRGLANNVDARGVTAIVCAGQKLDPTTLEATRHWAPNAAIWEYYGASELGFVAARCHRPDDSTEESGTSVGTAFPGVEVAILDEEGRPVPDGETGSIAVRSPLVCSGYLWGDDGQAFTQLRGMYTVRDQGFLRDGQLHVLGRAFEMINTGGLNVYPQEVETALAAVPAVADVVVAGVPDQARGQRVVAGIVGDPGGLNRLQLRAALDGRLPSTKHPHQYFHLQALPVTAAGKLSRTLFCRWILEGDSRVRLLG